jgi:very-short-patch-repair endonuclease
MRVATATENLAVEHPELAREWHPSKNGALSPTHVRSKSNKKVWWQCVVSPLHEWEAQVNARHRAGCPHCHKERRFTSMLCRDGKAEERTLGMCPDLMAELVASGDERREVAKLYVGSTRLLSWQCKQGHPRWRNQIRKRAVEGQGCPYCAGKKICAENSLAALNPLVAKEWDTERNFAEGIKGTPDSVSPGDHRRVWWRCAFGHPWPATVKQRVSYKTGCPKCRPKVSRFEVRIACEIAAALGVEVVRGTKVDGVEADIFLPVHRLVVEVDGFPWHSPVYHPGSLERDERKSKRLLAAGYKLLRVREQRLPAVPGCTSVVFNDGEAPIASCKEVVRAVAALLSDSDSNLDERAIAYLRGDALVAEDRYREISLALNLPAAGQSLLDLNPEIAQEWCEAENGPLTPGKLRPGSRLSVKWRCSTCKHIWQAQVSSRTSLKTGCPRCSGRVPTKGETLADLFPGVAREWDFEGNELLPDEVSPFSNRRQWWRCAAGHRWQMTVTNRTRLHQGCPYCAHKRASPEWNLARQYPEVSKFFDREYPEVSKFFDREAKESLIYPGSPRWQ